MKNDIHLSYNHITEEGGVGLVEGLTLRGVWGREWSFLEVQISGFTALYRFPFCQNKCCSKPSIILWLLVSEGPGMGLGF